MAAGPSSLDRLVEDRERARALYHRPAGLGALLLIAVLAVVSVIWGINNPRSLPDVHGQITVHRTLSVAHPHDFGVLPVHEDHYQAMEKSATVHVKAVAAHVTEDTANADITFSVCMMPYPRPASGPLPPLDELCTRVVPVTGVDLTIGPDSVQQLVMTVTATQPGTVMVKGVDVTYSDGWRHGTQTTGQQVRLYFG